MRARARVRASVGETNTYLLQGQGHAYAVLFHQHGAVTEKPRPAVCAAAGPALTSFLDALLLLFC